MAGKLTKFSFGVDSDENGSALLTSVYCGETCHLWSVNKDAHSCHLAPGFTENAG
jgi:hypothetical protein